MKNKTMNYTKPIILMGFIFVFTSTIYAQAIDIPRPSPKASVSQMIGVNNISVTYGRPSVKGRKIIGGLVPYDKVWRAGANEATTISFEHSVIFEGNPIIKGTYGLFMIPNENHWTIILNKEAKQWGAYNYNTAHDILRIKITPVKSSFTEQCTYAFHKVTKSEATLVLSWENTSIPMKIAVDVKKQTLNEIENKLNESMKDWYNFSAAAQYHFYELKELDKALEYINIAIALKAPNPSPWMLKSQILATQGKYKKAIQLAEEAIIICKKNGFDFEIHENEEHILKWKKRL